MIKLVMLRNKRSAQKKTLAKLQAQRAAQKKREEELEEALESAEEVSPELEDQVNALAEEQQNVDTAIAEAVAAIEQLDAAIEAEETAAADALETAIETDPEEVEDPADYVAGIRPGGARRSTRAGRQQRAAQFQRTGKQRIHNVPAFIRANGSPLLSTASGIAKPTMVDGINDGVGLNVVSSIIDMVTIEDCTGMGTHRVAYETSDVGEAAAYTPRGSVPTEIMPGLDFVDLTPSDYACLSYVDKGIRKVSPLSYEEKVHDSARVALRKRLSKIVVDAILASSLNVAQTVSATTIGASFLSDLILSYGGDEEIEGNAVLFLSKADLKAFAAVRGKNEYLPVYSIIPDEGNPNIGIIKDNYGLSTRYCLNRNVTSLSAATQGASAIKTMFYGNPKAAELDLWGDLDVDVSEGYKFAEGLLTVRGEVTADADVVRKNGFVVVTLAAT